MNRIDDTFGDLKHHGRKALIGYLTAGDPDLAQSEANAREALREGLDILELGVPFSDPTADGPTIQAASQRALASGVTLKQILEAVARLRKDFNQPIVLFGYANPFFSYGYEKFCVDAKAAGADGLLIVDLPFEEWEEIRPYTDRNDLCLIPLIAPTTFPDRAREILRNASGFVYYIMVKGVTGVREKLADDVAERIADLRRCTDLPIAAGFGVSTGPQAREAASLADAVVVGSALVEAARTGRLSSVVRELSAALR
jgi:tryptophan synthase alpha chain